MAKRARQVARTNRTQGNLGSSRQAQVTAIAAAPPTEDPNIIERISMAPDDRLLLTPTEAARRLSIGRTLCYELLRRGELASITIGARRCIPVAALDAFIQARLAHEGFQGVGA